MIETVWVSERGPKLQFIRACFHDLLMLLFVCTVALIVVSEGFRASQVTFDSSFALSGLTSILKISFIPY